MSGLRTYEAICSIYQVNVSLRLSVSEQLNLNNSLLYRVSGVSDSIDDRMEELCPSSDPDLVVLREAGS